MWTYFIIDLKKEEIVGKFSEKYLQKLNQNKFTAKKTRKRKWSKVCFLVKVGLIKKRKYKWVFFSLEPKSSVERVKAELDLSSYVAKEDLKNATGVNTPKFRFS